MIDFSLMRYYLYVSEAKLDMLAAQLPRSARRHIRTRTRAWTLGTRVPFGHASLRTTREDVPSFHARLAAVEACLRQRDLVGAVDDDAPWVQGDMEMRWVVQGPGAVRGAWARPEDAVLFWREDAERILLLGGSARHLIGAEVPEAVHRSYGSTLRGLGQTLAAVRHAARSRAPGAHLRDAFDATSLRWLGLDVLVLVDEYRNAPVQRLEFLARRHTTDLMPPTLQEHRKITLGTPLYVAVSDVLD